ncbi:hypothetical protein AMV092 [Betaentomopoxvirus amoorei]|uniref:AMV092 n=1 Tax=Amsacta moorei entomopoxvirus TaxID=28321 RepID=Q9EMV7_AMEPV|nr:hypothetical protein AMV092 [Amsacta moorei entomopoxvirus]AAG02798.1 AMV092 [Amsacta moorei entomopoxvirus]
MCFSFISLFVYSFVIEKNVFNILEHILLKSCILFSDLSFDNIICILLLSYNIILDLFETVILIEFGNNNLPSVIIFSLIISNIILYFIVTSDVKLLYSDSIS